MHDWFKANECVCIAKSEQLYVTADIKIFENEPKSWRSDGKTFYYYSDIFNYRWAFLKSTSYYTPLTTLFQQIFFPCQHNQYVRVAIYANSFILM